MKTTKLSPEIVKALSTASNKFAVLRASLGAMVLLGVIFFVNRPLWAQPKNTSPTNSVAGTSSEGLKETDKAKEKEDEKNPKVKVERGAGGKKVYRITQGFVIEGRIQKPNAFYVLQRSQINYDWADLKESFVPRILNAVNKSPF